jgi:hypothetical protein
MSDHFEKAMQGIATRSAENGGPTITDVLTALVAENDDAEDRHKETKLVLTVLTADVATFDSRIATLEKWRAGYGSSGDDHHTAAQTAQLVANTAEKTARELASSEEEGDIRRAWRVSKWFVLGAGIVLLNQFGNMWLGR